MRVEGLTINGRPIGPNAPCFIIAEAGVNHNGDLSIARTLVDTAASAGADAVKFQTFKASRLVTRAAPKAKYQTVSTNAAESQFDMLRELELSDADHRAIADHCCRRGILFLSTPFDESSADLLLAMDMGAFKLPSGEITNHRMLEHVGRFGRPIILSTGMADLEEVRAAVDIIRNTGNRDLAILHCVSNYPADPGDANLRAMATLQKTFGTPVGFSDHTLGIEVALAAVAMGASIIEKHFTLDNTMPGPDHKASLEPAALHRLISGIRTVESALGDGNKVPAESESDTAGVARKSLVAACDIHPGTRLRSDHLIIRRPGTGLPPSMEDQLVGRTANQFIPAETLIQIEMVE